jgi:hypothetical protein
MTTGSALSFTGNLTLNSSGTITGAAGISSTGTLDLTGTSIGSTLTPLTLGTVGSLNGTVNGASAATDVFNVTSVNPLPIGLISATANNVAHAVKITAASISPGGGGTITGASSVTLTGTPIGTLGVPLQASTIDLGNSCLSGTAACLAAENEFVNASGTLALAETVSTVNDILSGIQAALTTEQSGPSELLSSGVLPENIFKSLGSQVLEVVGGAEAFGVEGEAGEPVGVKIIDPVFFTPEGTPEGGGGVIGEPGPGGVPPGGEIGKPEGGPKDDDEKKKKK